MLVAVACAATSRDAPRRSRSARRAPGASRAAGHPFVVGPFVARQAVDARAGRRRHLLGEADRIGLERQQPAVGGRASRTCRSAPVRDAGNEELPDAGLDALAHGMAAAVPVVEVADDADPRGVRRPDGEGDAVDAVDGAAGGRRAARRGGGGCPRRSGRCPSRRGPAGSDRDPRPPRCRRRARSAGGRRRARGARRSRPAKKPSGCRRVKLGDGFAGVAIDRPRRRRRPARRPAPRAARRRRACMPSTAKGSPWRAGDDRLDRAVDPGARRSFAAVLGGCGAHADVLLR